MESSRLSMAILKIDHQIFNLKTGYHLIGSDKNVEIYINSKTIDAKHALLEISNNGMKIFDLHSKNGTFINGNKIDFVKSIELPKKCTIQFSNISGNLKLYMQNDSGYLEKLTTSDNSVENVSSPEENPETHTFYIHTKNKKKITSTPNNDMKLKTEYSSPSTKETNENSIQIQINSNNDQEDNENDKSSFFVPETQPISKINQQQEDFSISNCHDSIKGDCSFVVPETQPNTMIQENKTNDILSKITDENIRKNIENMSENDEYYIPATQEIFNGNNQSNNLNSQSSNLYKISTQEFNATPIGCGLLDALSDLSNDSENLFNGIQLSANIPLIKPTQINTNSTKSNVEISIISKINDFTTNYRHDDYDVEMAALKWSDTNEADRKNNSKSVSNSTTPDFILECNKISENNEKLEEIREDSITPDFILEINSKLNKIESNSVTPDLKLNAEFDTNNKKSGEKLVNSFKEIFNQNESNYNDLEPTQNFIKPVQRNDNNKSVQKNSLLHSNCDDDLAPTQIFFKNISCNHSDKTNNIQSHNSNESNIDKNSDSTELFVPPQSRSINNIKKSFVVENDNSLQPTQPFIREKINHVPETNVINFTLESEDDESSPIKQNSRGVQNKLMSSSDEEADFAQINKFKTPITSSIKKPITSSNCSSDSSIAKHRKNNSMSSKNSNTNIIKQYDNRSSDSNSQNNFDFITCTPQFDFIKPHQSLEIKQAGHLFNNKSKNYKILLEESSDEDDIDNLLNLLNKKNDKKPSRIKNSKRSTDRSTKRKNLVTEMGKRITSDTSEDSSTAQIRKSTRKTTKPNYIIQSYVTDNFTEQFSSDLDENSAKRTSSRKRPYKTDVDEDYEGLTKIKKGTSQQHNADKKKLKKNLSGNKRGDSEEILHKMDNNGNKSSDNVSGRITTRLHNKKLNYKFIFTKIDASKYRSIIESMGGQIVDNPKDATMLITTEIIRTCKFMVALAKGIPIVSNKWLDAVINSPTMSTSHNNFIINDPVNEKKFEFSLKKTLKLSAKNLIFKNYTFLITPKTLPPPSELIQIIACTGGNYVKEIPKCTIDISKFYVVSDKKDNKLWSKIRKSIPNVNIISTEGILLSVMQHSLRFNDHLLH